MSTDVSKSPSKVARPELVTATIDGIEVQVPKGTLVIRAAERLGIEIPRFCDHPLLDPVAACRACIIDVPDGGNGRPMKPQPACALTVLPNMVVQTAASSEQVAKHQSGMLEFLLINHPRDCPICDKGGECPLQNQTMSHGPGESRYGGVKRTYPKPVHISPQLLIDRERCVLCQRCTRFSVQISGDVFISLAERGALSQISAYATQPYESYFSGNIVQICPVGALTSVDYRFQARPFDLVSTTTTCEHCAAGCELRTDHRHYQVKRRLAGDDPQVNEEWSCDKGRFAFYYGRQPDRLTYPLVRRAGVLEPASWPEAIDAAVAGLRAAGERTGVLTGGRLTLETAYAHARFARAVLGTNSIDFRARPYGPDEAGFLAAEVAGRRPGEVTYADLEKAGQVVLVGFEPEDEAPIVFLRLRKAWRKHRTRVRALAPYASAGTRKMGGTLVPTVPGAEAARLSSMAGELDANTIVLVGERASLAPGTLAMVRQLAAERGVRWAWVPRRAGELAALRAGCLPTLLPGGRSVSDATARVDLQAAWGVERLPDTPGLDTDAMLAAAAAGELAALVVSGVEIADLADAATARAALAAEGVFVVSLEQRRSEASELADVVFPVALLEEQPGTFLNWELRERRVQTVNTRAASAMTEVRVLAALADALGHDLGFRTPATARASHDEIADWQGAGIAWQPTEQPPDAVSPAGEGLVLASWRLAVDQARCLDGAERVRATVADPVIRVSAVTAARLGITEGAPVRLSTSAGSCVLPANVTTDMVDGVVWAPMNSGVSLSGTLQAHPGDRVELAVDKPAGGVE